MPDVVQTGASTAIDFLAGFGKGMVQADINRREQEKHEFQKQRWQQEMTAFAAQDEFRRLQNENSRLEIDMRKTQFDDVVATREQTKGFVAGMADIISKVKGNPAEKQSQLLEAYTNLSAEFTQADRSFGDKFIDIYSKISQAERPKMGKIVEVKSYETGKKKRVILDVYGDEIRELKGEENLEIVNDKIAQGVQAQQDEFDLALQAFMAGKGAVLGAEGQSLNIDDFMSSLDGLDERTKSQVTMDWIFEIRDRLWADIHETSGTLDVRLGRMLTPVVSNKQAREALVRPYAKVDHTKDVERIIGKFSGNDKLEMLAAMASEFETLLPEYELPAVKLELARIQNKAIIEMRRKAADQGAQDSSQRSMSEVVEKDKRQKEVDLLGKFAGGMEGLQFGPKVTGSDWWSSFLGMESGKESEDEGTEAAETLNSMQENELVKTFKINQ